ncbi:uncharacterized protein [Antedon mediterranea]|uniref:uncharacterized protein n=1 Tax=Antedon mediterranea TaxID=105859 RepID=UPI003AF6E149
MNTLSLLSILLVLIALSAARPGRELRDADSEEYRRPNGFRNLRQKMQRQRQQQQQQQQNTEDSSSSSEEEEEGGGGETQDGSVLEIDPPQLSDLSSVVMGIESSLGDPALMVTTAAPEVEESGNVNETDNGVGINIPQVGGKNPTTSTKTTKEVVCPSTCPLEFDPVCGTDDVTYPSLCVFEAIVCKDVSLNTTVAHRGSCLEKATTNVP